MADIEAAKTAAPPQPATPARRSAAARAAWALNGFLSPASNVAIIFLLCMSYTCGIANALRIAAHWACGEGSVCVWLVVAELYFDLNIYALCLFAAVAFVLAVALFLHCFVMAQLLRRRWRREGKGREIALGLTVHVEAQDEAGEEDDGCDLDGDFSSITVAVAVLLMPMAVGLLMVVFAPARGSWEERLGSVLIDTGFFLASLTYSYVMFPCVVLAKVLGEWEKVRMMSTVLTYLYLIGDKDFGGVNNYVQQEPSLGRCK